MTVSQRGWLVQAASSVVRQRFYGALDACGGFCWTDDRARAERFPLREQAEQFAALHLRTEEWTVTA